MCVIAKNNAFVLLRVQKFTIFTVIKFCGHIITYNVRLLLYRYIKKKRIQATKPQELLINVKNRM